MAPTSCGLVHVAGGRRRYRTYVYTLESHFPVFPEFIGTSHADRYLIPRRKLVQEQIYTAASIILSARSAYEDGTSTDT